eukprot:gene25760-38812_t
MKRTTSPARSGRGGAGSGGAAAAGGGGAGCGRAAGIVAAGIVAAGIVAAGIADLAAFAGADARVAFRYAADGGGPTSLRGVRD